MEVLVEMKTNVLHSVPINGAAKIHRKKKQLNKFYKIQQVGTGLNTFGREKFMLQFGLKTSVREVTPITALREIGCAHLV